jgi:uncharacterized OB-fold protein
METKAWNKDGSLMSLETVSHMNFDWAIGLDGSREIFVGIRCPRCGKTYVPPRRICGPCFTKMSELVELGREGVIRAVTKVNYTFIDPDTGLPRPVPYDYGYIQLDGADNLFSHIVKAGSSVRVGDRVRAVFRKVKRGDIRDILHFEPVPAE